MNKSQKIQLEECIFRNGYSTLDFLKLLELPVMGKKQAKKTKPPEEIIYFKKQ